VLSHNEKQFKKGTLECVSLYFPVCEKNMPLCWRVSHLVCTLLVLSHNEKQFKKGTLECVSLYLPVFEKIFLALEGGRSVVLVLFCGDACVLRTVFFSRIGRGWRSVVLLECLLGVLF
jgi:hypothetical protein